MLLDPTGVIVISDNRKFILRNVDVSHSTVKSMIDISRAQVDDVGDGTTFVIVLAWGMLIFFKQLQLNNINPTVIISGHNLSL